MLWMIALLVFGYFFILAASVWLNSKAALKGKKTILILVLKNCAETAEAIMWDLFRLKSWNYRDLSFLVIDDKSEDDTLCILQTLRRDYPFLLISASLGKRYERIKKLQGEKVRVLKVDGTQSPRLVRKKIIFLLNQYEHETELPLRKYS